MREYMRVMGKLLEEIDTSTQAGQEWYGQVCQLEYAYQCTPAYTWADAPDNRQNNCRAD